MRTNNTSSVRTCLLLPLEPRLFLSASDLDSTFGSAGHVFTPLGADATFSAAAVQPDGKILAVGAVGGNFVVIRYNTSGTLDSSFGSGGKVITDFGSTDAAHAIAIQADGKIVVAGASGSNFAVARYTSAGALDATFDSDGKLTTDFGADDLATAVAIQTDGRIVVAGNRWHFGGPPWVQAVARYNANGSLDTSFDGDGKLLAPSPDDRWSWALYSDVEGMGIRPDGRIVLGGTVSTDVVDDSYHGYHTESRWGVTVIAPGGAVEQRYATPVATSSFSYAQDMQLQPDGSVWMLGGWDNLVLVHFAADGRIVATNFGEGLDLDRGVTPMALAVDSSGRHLVGGQSTSGQFMLARVLPNLTLDSSFGTAGVTYASGATSVGDVVLQDNGRIVVAGTDTQQSQTGFSLVRFVGDSASSTPFNGPHVPGDLIQAEDFDGGGEGVAYHDAEPANLGGAYRTAGVDMQPTSDAGGGYNIGWGRAGEWLKYTVNVPTAGTRDVQVRAASAGAGGTFHLEVDGVRTGKTMTVPNTGGWQTWMTLTDTGVNLPAGAHVLRLVMDSAGAAGFVGNFNWLKIGASSAQRSPFGGTPIGLGNVIQAENFDNGSEGIAYHDTEPANLGGAYRSTGVDIQPTTDAGGGYNIGWTRVGEWLEYTVSVPTAGLYRLELRTANPLSGAEVHLNVNGVAATPQISLPGTGGWQNFATTVSEVYLNQGTQVLRLSLDKAATNGYVANVNWLRLALPTALPARIQAEDFDAGADGLTFHDLDAANLGGACRNTPVDIQPTTDAGGGYNVGWVRPGEWLSYTVNVPAAGRYNFDFRVASAGGGGVFHLEVDGARVTNFLTVPNTGDWQRYVTLTENGVNLPAGSHVLRLVADSAGASGLIGNFNWFEART